MSLASSHRFSTSAATRKRRLSPVLVACILASLLGCGDDGDPLGEESSELAPCEDAADCGPAGECFAWSCSSGECVQVGANAGAPIAEQTAGDCMEVRCDGAGGTEEVVDDNDVPAADGECTAGACTNGEPGQVPENEGLDCQDSSGVCTSGVCLQHSGNTCADDSDCLSGFCTDGVCCKSLCSGICATCAASGDGTCTIVPPNTEDPGTCEGELACTGGPGSCKLKLGELCDNNIDCITNNCGGIPKVCQ